MTTPTREPDQATTSAATTKDERAFTDTPQFKIMATVMGAANPFMRRLLASGHAGRLGKALLLLEFKGRTSGETYRTPVGYARDGDRVIVVTSPTYAWWKNVVGGADVRVRLPDGWHDGHARIVRPDDPDYDDVVATQVSKRGTDMLRGFGIDVDDAGHVAESSKAKAGERAHMVEIRLSGAPG